MFLAIIDDMQLEKYSKSMVFWQDLKFWHYSLKNK